MCGMCVGPCYCEDGGFSGDGDDQLNEALLQHAAACLKLWLGHV